MTFECNICGGTEFVAMNARPAARCKKCGSLERTRLLMMYIERLGIQPDWRILHLAPEASLYGVLSKAVAKGNYVTADYQEDKYRRFAPDCRHIDLCDLDDWDSDYFDLIIHSHVLEHTWCNVAYSLFHLHRMLTARGKHVCIIPFGKCKFEESFQDISAEERARRFGQHDHVRRFGNMDIHRHLGSILRMPDKFDASQDFPEEILTRANIPRSQWQGFTIATVLTLGKYDMKFMPRPRDAVRAALALARSAFR